jgi:hypothetical protein
MKKRGAQIAKIAQQALRGRDKPRIKSAPFSQSFLVGLPGYRSVTLLNDLGINPEILRKNIRPSITAWQKAMQPVFKEDYGRYGEDVVKKYLVKTKTAVRIEKFDSSAKKVVDELIKGSPELIVMPMFGSRIFYELLPKEYQKRVLFFPSETDRPELHYALLDKLSGVVKKNGIKRAAVLDDIILTGNVMSRVGSALKTGGAEQVSGFALSVPGPIVKGLKKSLEGIDSLFVAKEPRQGSAILPVSKYIAYFGNKKLREIAAKRKVQLGP